MKKLKQEKKNNISSAKDLQLPKIQTNIQKGKVKESPSNVSKTKILKNQ